MATFKRYTYHNPEAALPVERDDTVGMQEAEAAIMAAGFSPADEETWIGRLTATWHGHAAGSLVVSELTAEGHRFAVEAPGSVINALKRLERAGSESSRTTEKLREAARQLGAHVSGLVPDARWVAPNYPPQPQLPGGYYSRGGQIGRYDYAEHATVYVDSSRNAALAFAAAIADGWLDELAAWLEARASESTEATARLERAAEAMR